jgi:outer membrane lipoprotein-sorting protein
MNPKQLKTLPARTAIAALAGIVLIGLAGEALAATEPPIPLVPIPVPRQQAAAPATTTTTPTSAPFDALVDPAAAPPITDPAIVLQNISSYFNSIRTMQGQFIQIGPNDQRSEGTFYLSRPGKVRFRYQPPVRVEVVSDGKSLSVEDKNAGTQDLYPLSKTPLRALLANNIDLAQMRIVGDLRQEGDLISVELAEPTFGDGKLTLMFDKTTYELRQWVVTDAQGLNTSVALYNVTTGEPLDPQLFRIYITGNTKMP